MNFNAQYVQYVQLAPGYLQKNIPEYKLYEDMNENPLQFVCYKNYIDNIKQCVNFEDGFDNLNIKSFIAFNIQKPNLLDLISHSYFYHVETKSGNMHDNTDRATEFKIEYIKNILDHYENVITFNQYFEHKNQYACLIIMLCYNKKILRLKSYEPTNSIEPIDELKNDIAEIKKIVISLEKQLSWK